jgi:putative transposase
MLNHHRASPFTDTYFFTLVTHDRRSWLCHDLARTALRTAFVNVRQKYPLAMDACVLLPNHLHCIWTLPEGDREYAKRWQFIKSYVTKRCGKDLMGDMELSAAQPKRQDSTLWQPRFWEHPIRDAAAFSQYCDYIHYNPVQHGLCNSPQEWEFSSIHRFVEQGIYQPNWGTTDVPMPEADILDVL